MRLRQKINKKLVVGILLFLKFFPLTALPYFVVNRFIQKRRLRKLEEASLSAEEDSPKTQINPHLSRRKINKKLVIGILFLQALVIIIAIASADEGDDEVAIFFGVLFITTPIATLAYLVVNRFIQKRMLRKLDEASLKAEVDSPKTQINPHLSQRKINKKLVIGIFLLLVLIIIIAIASADDGDGAAAIFFGVLSIATLGFLVVDRFIQKRKVRELKGASLRAEVDLLKTQINPHFFFNTLNNLYGLTVEKSDMAPEVILKLSDMMRYTIYEGEKDRVALKDEITYLENFIELQKIRFHRELDIKFEHFIEEVDIKVPPLLFIVLVENAFKHGAESLTENAFIHMKLMSMDGSVLFETQNNFEADETPKIGGIGLKNLQRRLQLLFPDRHTLHLDGTGNGVYKATLKFNLS